MCKHTVGMLFKSCFLEATPDVRSVPLGQKRRKGRPKKLPNCLVNSPVRAPGPLPPCNDDLDIPSWDDLEIPPIEEDVEIPTFDEEVPDDATINLGVKKTTRKRK